MSEDIWEDGYESYFDGLDLEDNPHPKESDEHREWEDGWNEAEVACNSTDLDWEEE